MKNSSEQFNTRSKQAEESENLKVDMFQSKKKKIIIIKATNKNRNLRDTGKPSSMPT